MAGSGNQRIEAIQVSGYGACIAISGGGIGALHALLAQPGAARFVLDARIPYSRAAMHEYLGEVPDTYCSKETVRKMARTALHYASRFTDHALGIACTAALQTRGERTDPDRAWLCVCAADRMLCERVELPPVTRAEQDKVVSDALLSLVGRFVGE